MPERRSWLNEPMMLPELLTLIELYWLGRMPTTSADAIGSSVAPRDSIGWPKARMRFPSTWETVPVPDRLMSPTASATATTSPGLKARAGRCSSSLVDDPELLPPSAETFRPSAAYWGSSEAATFGARPPNENAGLIAVKGAKPA